MRGIPMRCGACKSWIVWGTKNARPHPYNAQFDAKGRAHQGTSHFLTCPYADNWHPKRHKTLRARADRHTADIQRWRASCCNSVLKHYRKMFWNGILIYDVPEKHAIPIAWKLAERGGPFYGHHPLDLLVHFEAVAVRNGLVMWVMPRDVIFNRIHAHLHGFSMDLASGMPERLPVIVAGYRLEPFGVLPQLPYNQVKNFSLAEVYTLERKTHDW